MVPRFPLDQRSTVPIRPIAGNLGLRKRSLGKALPSTGTNLSREVMSQSNYTYTSHFTKLVYNLEKHQEDDFGSALTWSRMR